MRYLIALLIAMTFNAVANLLIKVGMKSVDASGGLFKDGAAAAFKTVWTSAPLLVGLTCFALNAVFYMYALQSRSLKISIAYPIMVGGGFVLIALIARLHPALAERLTLGQVLGVGLVLLGIVLIAAQQEPVA
jgi:multidrug transporter EmrE-like cation transporter